MFESINLREEFKNVLLQRLKEDIPRSDKYLEEDKILQDIIESIKNSNSNDKVWGDITQKEFYSVNCGIITNVFKRNLYVYFSIHGDSAVDPNKIGLYSKIDNLIYINLSGFRINFVNNLESNKKILLRQLEINSDLILVLHHEIAHMMFGKNLSDKEFIKLFLDTQQNGVNSANEYNSYLSEFYSIAELKFNRFLRDEKTVKEFLFFILLNKSQSMEGLKNFIITIKDFDKFVRDMIRFSRKMDSMSIDEILELLHQKLNTDSNKRFINNFYDLNQYIKQNGFNPEAIKQNSNPREYYTKCIQFLKSHSDPSLNLSEEFDNELKDLSKDNDVLQIKKRDEKFNILHNCQPDDGLSKDDLDKVTEYYENKKRFFKWLFNDV